MTCSKLYLFTNTRYSTQGMFTFYSAEIATANRLFLGSNSPKPLRTNTSDPRASSASAPERASGENPKWKIRQLFPKGSSFPRRPLFSVTKTTPNASRAVWLDDEIPPAWSGLNTRKTWPIRPNPSSAASEARWNILFCLIFQHFQTNRTNDEFFAWWKTCPWRPHSWSATNREKSR